MRDAYLKRLAGEAVVESMLRDELQRQRVERLFETADRLAAVGEPPLTDAEVEAEVRAIRSEAGISGGR